MIGQYDFWMRALAGEEVGGPTLPVHEDEINSGFFRKRTKRAGGYEPVALWRDAAGTLICLLNGRETNPADVWPHCAPHAISEQAYRDYMASGRWWDEDDAIAASLEPPTIGHNEPPDRFTVLNDQIEAALQGIETYAKIEDDATEAKAQSKRSRLNELFGEADGERESLKRPHLDANTAIDKQWQPICKAAKAGADKIRDAMNAYGTAKLKAEQKRLADEQAKAQAAAFKHGPLGAHLEVAAAPAVAPSLTVTATVRGGYGRGAGKKLVGIFVMEDQDKVYQHYRGVPELTALLQKLAQTDVNNGLTPPGGKIEQQVRTS